MRNVTISVTLAISDNAAERIRSKIMDAILSAAHEFSGRGGIDHLNVTVKGFDGEPFRLRTRSANFLEWQRMRRQLSKQARKLIGGAA